MYTTFHVKADELDKGFLKKLKTIFKRKSISISVEEDLDETEYLLSNSANRKMLEKSLAEAESGNLIKVDIDKHLRKK